jgi:hypothetical protein
MELHLSIRSYNYLSFHQPPEKGKHASCVEHLTNYKTRIQEKDLCKTKCKTRENFACIQNVALNFEQDYANKYACHDIGELSGNNENPVVNFNKMGLSLKCFDNSTDIARYSVFTIGAASIVHKCCGQFTMRG